MFGKFQIKFLLSVSFVLSIFLFASAYDAETTHAGLSQEIVEYYQLVTQNSISEKNAEALILGSVLEDVPSSRVTRHFYDPVNDKGLLGMWQSSKGWLNASKNEFAWSRGIDAYANGDTEKAFEILGHSLHLLEDASVPDHTRNDPHASLGLIGFYSNSPYENWTQENKDRETMVGLGELTASKEKVIPKFDSAEEALSTMATFSNNNFLSKDTLISGGYVLPKKIDTDGIYIYGNLASKRYKLALIKDENFGISTEIVLSKKDDSSVISDYFSILGPEAVKNGAGMIALFIKQGEEAKAERVSEDDEFIPVEESAPKETFFETLKKGFTIVPEYLKTLFQSGEDIARSLAAINQALVATPEVKETAQNIIAPVLSPLKQFDPTLVRVDSDTESFQDEVAIDTRIKTLQEASEALKSIESQLITYARENNISTTVSSSDNNIISRAGGSGTTDEEIPLEISTTTTPIIVDDTSTSTDPVLDIIAPTFSITASNCLFTLSTECTSLATTTVLSWNSSDMDLLHWNYENQGVFATTTATSTILNLSSATTTFSLSAIDISGNISATTTLSIFKTVEIIPEVVIPPTILIEDTVYEQDGYHEFDTDLVIPEGVTLTIKQGNVLLFAPDKSLYVYGNLILDGERTTYTGNDFWEIYFDRKGDEGYWGGIYIAPTIGNISFSNVYIYHSEGVVFDGVTGGADLRFTRVLDGNGVGIAITNGSSFFMNNWGARNIDGDAVVVSDSVIEMKAVTGRESDTCFSLSNSTITIQNGKFQNCITGISLTNGSVLTASNFTYAIDNLIGISVLDSEGSIHRSYIYGNSIFGVFLENGVFDATKIFWGDETGPFHPENNPEGLGNPVSDGVIFDPWLEQLSISIG